MTERNTDFVAATRHAILTSSPPVQSLMDVDFYKFTMGQLIHRHYPTVEATFRLIIRDTDIPLAGGIVREEEARAALDYARSLRFRRTDLYYLRGMDVYGRNMFSEEYLDFLRNFQLPPYAIHRRGTAFELEFSGRWIEVSMWETIALAIFSELYYRALVRQIPDHELEIVYARARDRLYTKLEKLASHPGIRFADFGQRRRHSFLWQKWVLEITKEVVKEQLTGTSNTWMAFKHDFVPIGTNAHELPMVLAALADSPDEKRQAQYAFLALWEHLYGQGLRIFLPDTYGTEQFLAGAPSHLAEWRGFRQDSGDPISQGDAYVAWLEKLGADPKKKLIIFSDGLDADRMIELDDHFADRIGVAFGWGTLLTNDFRGCYTGAGEAKKFFRPFSMVCKVVAARSGPDVPWRPAVKLSDNIRKATGPADEVRRYLEIFEGSGRSNNVVLV